MIRLVFAAVMSLAGVDFFQTDYPLELAQEGKALRVYSDAAGLKTSGAQEQLMELCSISGTVAETPLGVALAAE